MSRLAVHNLTQHYGTTKVLKDISFHASEGEIVALLGPNGAGKTTLLRTVMGLLPVATARHHEDDNALVFENSVVNDWSVADRVENGLLYLPQQTSLFSRLSVRDNLRLVYENHSYWRGVDNEQPATFSTGFDPSSEAEARKMSGLERFNLEMHKWLKRTGLTTILNRKCQHLSGGQKRKLEVVRSLLLHPRAIMLDEPFAAVDPKSIYELKSIFVDLAKRGITIVISDHNVDQLLSIAHRIYVMIDGEVIVSGGIKDIMENEYTRDMYFGTQFFSEMHKRYID